MLKIAFIGAGSFEFTRKLVTDLMTFPAFNDIEIALMDINQERLDYIYQACTAIITQSKYKANLTATTDRRKALTGANGIVCTILQGSIQDFESDIAIPMKFGVDINVGDTRGPSGIFRALRTLPMMLDICKDIKELCPKAIFLNYTNPMALLCSGMKKVYPELQITGLCHSVQGTAKMMADWIGANFNDITYTCAGINHQSFFLEFNWKGENAYPLIREAIFKKNGYYQDEIVRNEIFRHLDFYVTESSGHNSEYNAWFRKRPDLIERYCTHGRSWNPGHHAFILKRYQEMEECWRENIQKEISELQGRAPKENCAKEEFAGLEIREYASDIFNAVFGDQKPFLFNGNVPNFNIIDNLPYGCCVEVPVAVDKKGFQPIHVGPLPDHLAILVNTNARIEELAIQGILKKDYKKIFQAIAFDPLTSAVLCLQEIKDMVDEMFVSYNDYCRRSHLLQHSITLPPKKDFFDENNSNLMV